MTDFRWFPFLGYRTATRKQTLGYDELFDERPDVVAIKMLTFEWLNFYVILVGQLLKDGEYEES